MHSTTRDAAALLNTRRSSSLSCVTFHVIPRFFFFFLNDPPPPEISPLPPHDPLPILTPRRYQQSSHLGAFLDPMADKLLMTACFIVLALPDHPKSVPDFHMINHIPVYLTIVTISRDVFIVIIALLVHLTSGLTSFRPTFLGKLTTVVQVVKIGTVILLNYLGE